MPGKDMAEALALVGLGGPHHRSGVGVTRFAAAALTEAQDHVGESAGDGPAVAKLARLDAVAVRVAGSNEHKDPKPGSEERLDARRAHVAAEGDGMGAERLDARGVMLCRDANIAALGIEDDEKAGVPGVGHDAFESGVAERAVALKAGALGLDDSDDAANGVDDSAGKGLEAVGWMIARDGLRDLLDDRIEPDAGGGSRGGDGPEEEIGEAGRHRAMVEPTMDAPARLDLKRDRGLTILWSDGRTSYYSIAYLRRMSPSAEARELREELSMNRLAVLPASEGGALTALGAELVGNYALRIEFSDGHRTGLYTWAYLRSIDPAGGGAAPA